MCIYVLFVCLVPQPHRNAEDSDNLTYINSKMRCADSQRRSVGVSIPVTTGCIEGQTHHREG